MNYKKPKIMKKNILILSFLMFLTSCVETVIVGSVASTIAVTRQKTLKDTKNDVVIAAKIDKEFALNGLKTMRNSVKIMVNEGRVLLTGVVRDLDKGQKANQIVWKIEGVKELIDEIQIEEKGLKTRDFSGFFVDSFTTSRVKSKLFFNPKITAADFKITTSNDVVYILGVAKNNQELNEVLKAISTISGVKRVVNHAILVSDHRRNG